MDPFETLHKIVKKDCIDAATFDMKTQADLLSMLLENLEMLEKVVFMAKALLKEPDYNNFEDVKDYILEKNKTYLLEKNPYRATTPRMS